METINRYSELGASLIVVKDAGSSIYGKQGDNPVVCVETKKKPLVDSTGAGDSFNGVFLSAYIEGYSLKESIRKAHNISSYVIGFKGALVPMQDVKKIYKSDLN